MNSSSKLLWPSSDATDDIEKRRKEWERSWDLVQQSPFNDTQEASWWAKNSCQHSTHELYWSCQVNKCCFMYVVHILVQARQHVQNMKTSAVTIQVCRCMADSVLSSKKLNHLCMLCAIWCSFSMYSSVSHLPKSRRASLAVLMISFLTILSYSLSRILL